VNKMKSQYKMVDVPDWYKISNVRGDLTRFSVTVRISAKKMI
jgi:hypothetical protein